MKLIGKNLITKKKLQLSRIDLCYVHNKTNNNISVQSFLKKCYEKVVENNAIKNFSLQKNSSSFILRIGKGGSPNFYRVSQKNTEIRFELEQRGTKIKTLQKLIFKGHLKEFEQIMIENFFKYSKKVLVIDENHTDWLIDYLKRKNKPKESLSLITGYFSQNIDNLMNTDDKKKFLDFYNLSLLVILKQPIQKLFGINRILSFNLKLPTLWILFKFTIKININEKS